MTDLFGMPATIPTLSLWEPRASLIAAGFKRHETRHWPTRVRGRVAGHAAKRCDAAGAADRLCEFAFGPDWAKTRPAGCVVAVATLTRCARTEDVELSAEQSDLLSGNYEARRFAFRLDDVRPLREPIPLKGAQGFFSWAPPTELADLLLPAVDHHARAREWLQARHA